jgi:molybdopterin-guanine dinucleotide biosynthesis protein A
MRNARSGFVLAGGQSSRMGRDKALLDLRGRTMVEVVAAAVAEAAGSATLIGPLERYGMLGLPVIEDRYRDCGPLGGIHAALESGLGEWNLIVACDMPEAGPDFLRGLLEAAEVSGADCLIPVGPEGRPEPLCAVYHQRCLPEIEKALQQGVRKVTGALHGLRAAMPELGDRACFRNVNTSAEWTFYQNG